MSNQLNNDELRELLQPFGDAGIIVGAKRVQLYDVVRDLITSRETTLIESILAEMPEYNSKNSRQYLNSSLDKRSHKNGYRLAIREVTAIIKKRIHKSKIGGGGE